MVAGISSYVYEKDPEQMANVMLDLHWKGQAQLKGIILQSGREIRRAVGSNTFDKNAGLAGQLVDQMLLMSMAHTFKDYINLTQPNYDPGGQNGLWASGTLAKFVRGLTAFGFDISAVGGDTRLVEPYGSNETIILNSQNIKNDVFLYVASAAFKNPPAGASDPNDNTTIPYLPPHFIRIRNFQMVGNNYTMEYLDYGEWESHTINKVAFGKAIFGIISITKK